jgi:hypothetical protein
MTVAQELAAARKAMEPHQREMRRIDDEVSGLLRESGVRRKEMLEATARLTVLTKRQAHGENVSAELTKTATSVQTNRQVLESIDQQVHALQDTRRAVVAQSQPVAERLLQLEQAAELATLEEALTAATADVVECEKLLFAAKRKQEQEFQQLDIFRNARRQESLARSHEQVKNDYNLRHGIPGQRPSIMAEPQLQPSGTGL